MKRGAAAVVERWRALLFGGAVACAAPSASGLSLGEAQAAGPFDAVVVLGNRPPRLDDGRLNPELVSRLRHGVELFRRGVARRLVLTGGPTAGGPSEARVMAELASELGVGEEAMLLEERSQDTIENARFSARILCERQPCRLRVLVVTNRYHGPRALRLFRCAGLRAELSASALPEGGDRRARASERWVGLYYSFIDECERAKP